MEMSHSYQGGTVRIVPAEILCGAIRHSLLVRSEIDEAWLKLVSDLDKEFDSTCGQFLTGFCSGT